MPLLVLVSEKNTVKVAVPCSRKFTKVVYIIAIFMLTPMNILLYSVCVSSGTPNNDNIGHTVLHCLA